MFPWGVEIGSSLVFSLMEACLHTRNVPSPASPNTAGVNNREQPPCFQLHASLASTQPKSSLEAPPRITLHLQALLSFPALLLCLGCTAPSVVFAHTHRVRRRLGESSTRRLRVSGHIPARLVPGGGPFTAASGCLNGECVLTTLSTQPPAGCKSSP